MTAVPTRLLVYGMAHADGTVEGTELFPVAEACGLSSDQVRSCLRRMVSDGLFVVSAGSGRSAVYTPTPSGQEALASFLHRTRLAYAQDQAGRGWDGHWHLVAFGIPEARRAARDALRDRLVALGGAAIHNGLYVSPHRWEADVVAAVGSLGVAEWVTVAATDELSVGGVSAPAALAARLWPLASLSERYEGFLAAHSYVPGYLEELRSKREHMTDEVFVSGALRVTVEFQAVFNDDPLLPPELLPRPWPGRAARELLLRSRRLAMQLRSSSSAPTLFRTYDEAIESLR